MPTASSYTELLLLQATLPSSIPLSFSFLSSQGVALPIAVNSESAPRRDRLPLRQWERLPSILLGTQLLVSLSLTLSLSFSSFSTTKRVLGKRSGAKRKPQPPLHPGPLQNNNNNERAAGAFITTLAAPEEPWFFRSCLLGRAKEERLLPSSVPDYSHSVGKFRVQIQLGCGPPVPQYIKALTPSGTTHE